MPSLLDGADNFPPKTELALFLGGPKHGQYIEVVVNDPVHRVIGPPGPAVSRTQPGYPFNTETPEAPKFAGDGLIIYSYVKRSLDYCDPTDQSLYTRSAYVFEEVVNPELAQQLLMAALIAEFVKGGRKVIKPHDPNR